MLTCLPQSLCSWNYRVLGAAAGPALLTFDFFTEQGALSLGGDHFSIVKHGWLSGFWTLEQRGQTLADARKPSAFMRTFIVRSADLDLTLQPQAIFTRGFDLLLHARPVGHIQPVHPFTRRAFITCAPEIPELLQLFGFWLTALAWRRAARNRSGG